MTTVKHFVDRIERELESHGIEDWTVEHGGKHPYLLVPGVAGQFTFAGSSGDQKAVHNMLCDLRKWLGVKRVVVKNPKNRQRRKVARRDPPAITAVVDVRNDWRERLREAVVTVPAASPPKSLWQQIVAWWRA